MNKSFPYNCRERGVRERTSKWIYPVSLDEQKEYANQLRKNRILGNVKAFVVGCLVGVVIQLVL